MNQALQQAHLSSLSATSLEQVIEHLPAEQRAQLAWGPTELRTALLAYVNGPQSEESLHAAILTLAKTFDVVRPFILEQLTTAPLELQYVVESAWQADLAALRGCLDPTNRELAAFAVHAWGATMRAALRDMAKAPPAEIHQMTSPSADKQVAMPGSPLRVQALLMAATEGARNGADTNQIVPIVQRAFDEASMLITGLRAAGLVIDPFEGETPEQRRARLRTYVENLREELDDDDLAALENARLRTMR